ncbi:MAG: T9SS type A sorting domain-containing protein [Saprospiraceae bacterium]|nr:T9SS type A sorting domain-containing protein [Candidatus Defluviibacterium haderslevense]
MKKIVLILITKILCCIDLTGQCTPPAADNCQDANVICNLFDLDGYTCSNANYSNPTGCTPLCPSGGESHNTSWWAFNAAAGPLSITVTYSNCTVNGTGVQMGIWGDCSCVESLACNPNCIGPGSYTIDMMLPESKTYYLFVDGCSGDVCDFTININGNNNLPPLEDVSLINNDPDSTIYICQGEYNYSFFVDTVETANYIWTLDQIKLNKYRSSIKLDFPNLGEFELCVKAIRGNPVNNQICQQTAYRCAKIIVNQDANQCLLSSTASGKVYIDENNNGIYDALDTPILNRTIHSLPRDVYISSKSFGYFIKLDTQTTNTLSIDAFDQNLWNIDPIIHTIATTSPSYLSNSYDFRFSSKNITDLELAGTIKGRLRPGNILKIKMQINNLGSTKPSPYTVKLVAPQNWTYESGTPVKDTIIQDTIIWFFNQEIPYFGIRSIEAEFKIPQNTPLGDSFNIFGIVETLNDINTINNSINLQGVIVNSHDPNYKTVNANTLPLNYPNNQELIYTIHFQNTGNDSAYHVMLVDTLSPFLNPGTIRIINSSHTNEFTLLGNNILSISFPDIALVDSLHNFDASSGFIQFAIKPLPGLPVGTFIQNTASIYFDQNSPILTNLVQTEILGPSGTSILNSSTDIVLFPNPTQQYCTVISKKLSEQSHLELFDIYGKKISRIDIHESGYTTIDLTSYIPGTYLVCLVSLNKTITRKKLIRY